MGELKHGRAATAGALAVLVLVLAAAGTFGGNWAWQAYQQRQLAAQAEVARLAAEADAKAPRGRARAALKRLLHDPDSAQFSGERAGRQADVWCGVVNAKNRMGGFVGARRFYVDLMSDAQLASMDEAVFEPDPDRAERVLIDLFDSRFSARCE